MASKSFAQGTAFPDSERERLGLRGLLPTKVTDMKLQVRQLLVHYKNDCQIRV